MLGKGSSVKQIYDELYDSNQARLKKNLRFFTQEQLETDFVKQVRGEWKDTFKMIALVGKGDEGGLSGFNLPHLKYSQKVRKTTDKIRSKYTMLIKDEATEKLQQRFLSPTSKSNK